MTAPTPPRPSRRAKAVKPVKAWATCYVGTNIINPYLVADSRKHCNGYGGKIVSVLIVPAVGYRVVRVKGKPAPASGKGKKGGKR